jgi:hypothetical protein
MASADRQVTATCESAYLGSCTRIAFIALIGHGLGVGLVTLMIGVASF